MSRVNWEKSPTPVKDILNAGVVPISKMMEKRFPLIWQRLDTRSIASPPGYYSSKALPVGLCGAIVEYAAQGMRVESNMGIIAGVLASHNFPLYYVSGPLFEALSKTHPPKDLTWKDVKLPFPALFFMIPRGILAEPSGLEIIGLGVSKIPDSVNVPTLGVKQIFNAYNKITVFWLVGPSALEMNDLTFSENSKLEPDPDWINRVSTGRPYNGPPGEFTAVVAGMVANIILVMQARPELVEPGGRIRALPKSKKIEESPTFIGRNYKVLHRGVPKTETKSHFTELGWRSGYLGTRWIGQGKTEQKTVWVEPYVAMSKGLVANEGSVDKD